MIICDESERGMVGRPLTQRDGSLSVQVYEALKEGILSFAHPPGMAFKKAEICQRFDVSRAPVAEAFARLASDGLVDVVPQSGTRVSLLSMEEIREASFLREALELAAVEKAAQERTDQTLNLLMRNLRLQKFFLEDQDFDGFYKADEQFHTLIIESTGFKRIPAIIESLSLQITRARRLLLPAPGRARETLLEHSEIFEAIEKKRPALARKVMRHHLGQLIDRLTPLQDEKPDFFMPGRL